MRKTVVALPLCALVAFVACGRGTNPPESPQGSDASDEYPDGSGARLDATTTSDAGPSATDAAIAEEAGDDTLPLVPIVSGIDLKVLGVTSDDYAIYGSQEEYPDIQIFAAPLDGGAPLAVGAPSPSSFVRVLGTEAFVWTDAQSAYALAEFGLWTSTAGYVSLGTSLPGWVWANGDGSTIAFVAGSTESIEVATVPGENPTTVSSVDVESSCPVVAALLPRVLAYQACSPDYTGSGLNLFFPDAGVGVGLVTLPASGAGVLWSVDSTGDLLYAPNGAGGGALYPLPSAAPTPLDDPTAVGGILIPDGTALLYATAAGALRRTPTTVPSSTTLVPSGATGLLRLSFDGSTVAFYTNAGTNSAGLVVTDLSLASATIASSPRQLLPSPGPVLLFLGYTSDSSYLTYDSSPSDNAAAGTLFAVPTKDGGAPLQLGSNVTFEWLPSGSKVVFDDNYDSTTGLFDIHAVNLAVGGPPVLVAGSANDFEVTSDRARIVYTTNEGAPGLYVVQVP